MWQQGQVFKLKARGVDGQPLWAYRYRLEGRGSARPQVGGFATRAEARKALEKVLARLGPGGRGGCTLGQAKPARTPWRPRVNSASPGLLARRAARARVLGNSSSLRDA
jgi:hypothetical protein